MKNNVTPNPLSNISPYIRRASYSVIPAPWHLSQRVLLDYEIIYVKEGEVTVTLDNGTFPAKPGDAIFLRPNQRHSIRLIKGDNFVQPHIHLDLVQQEDSPMVPVSFEDKDELTPQERQHMRPDILGEVMPELPTVITLNNPQVFEMLLYEIINIWCSRPSQYELLLKYKAIRLLAMLLLQVNREQEDPALPLGNDMLGVQTYILANYQKPISIDLLCRTFAISKSSLSARFKKAFGLSVIEFYNQVRVQKAKDLLACGRSITEVSELLNFSSVYAFSRFMKTHTGSPPSAFLRQPAQ